MYDITEKHTETYNELLMFCSVHSHTCTLSDVKYNAIVI